MPTGNLLVHANAWNPLLVTPGGPWQRLLRRPAHNKFLCCVSTDFASTSVALFPTLRCSMLAFLCNITHILGAGFSPNFTVHLTSSPQFLANCIATPVLLQLWISSYHPQAHAQPSFAMVCCCIHCIDAVLLFSKL